MQSNFLLLFLTFITINSFGQINFERAYFIDNNNQRVECLIKNNEWKDNPVEFKYKITANGDIEKGTLDNVKEFGVIGFSRYVRAETKIDVSSYDVNNFSKDRNPEWSQRKMFLKVLVEGKAKLYYYENSGLIRFLFSVSDSSINQLIFKEYYDTTKAYYVINCEYSVNKKFHEQLWLNVRCPNTATSDIERLNYRKSDLMRYFIKYNECNNVTPVVYDQKAGKNSFHLKISPGINYSSLSVSNGASERYNTDFGNMVNLRIGLEAEYILPFNKNKWGLFFEPAFQYFYSEKEMSTFKATIHYNSIDFPVGLRYYFFLNQDLKLFVDATYILSASSNLNSAYTYQSTVSSILPTVLDIKTGDNYSLGAGIAFKKISTELRYSAKRDLFNGYGSWYSEYQKFSLILGFSVF